MAEIPGFRRASTAAAAWISALTKQGDVINNAWDGILKGGYGPRELMRDSAQLYQSQFQALESLLSNSAPGTPNVPSWLTLDATKNQTLQALSGTVETRPYDAMMGSPTATQLAAFSGPTSRFEMKVASIDSTHLLVSIVAFSYIDEDDDTHDIALSKDEDLAGVIELADGPYLGIIYDQRGGTNAPLAVVTLMI